MNLDNIYTYHAPVNDKQMIVYGEIRRQAKALAHYFLECVPEGRERSVALTKLEEAVMWANAGAARNGSFYLPKESVPE